jgi:hypothetical protein
MSRTCVASVRTSLLEHAPDPYRPVRGGPALCNGHMPSPCQWLDRVRPRVFGMTGRCGRRARGPTLGCQHLVHRVPRAKVRALVGSVVATSPGEGSAKRSEHRVALTRLVPSRSTARAEGRAELLMSGRRPPATVELGSGHRERTARGSRPDVRGQVLDGLHKFFPSLRLSPSSRIEAFAQASHPPLRQYEERSSKFENSLPRPPHP